MQPESDLESKKNVVVHHSGEPHLDKCRLQHRRVCMLLSRTKGQHRTAKECEAVVDLTRAAVHSTSGGQCGL